MLANLIDRLLQKLGVHVDYMTREQAAAKILEREIRVLHKPLIVEFRSK